MVIAEVSRTKESKGVIIAQDVDSLSLEEDYFWNLTNIDGLISEEEKKILARLKKDKKDCDYLGRYAFERVEKLVLKICYSPHFNDG